MSPPPPSPKKKGRSNGKALFLAVVVGLIPAIFVIGGIVAAIAIPNFQKFQGKAKQSEAKIGLSAAFTGEQLFITEWNAATSDMVTIGIPEAGAKAKYHFGFAQPANAQWETIGVDPTTHDASRSDTEKAGVTGPELGAPFAELAAMYCPECVADGVSFKMVAIGNIDSDATHDVWTIDQDRQITNVVDDTKE